MQVTDDHFKQALGEQCAAYIMQQPAATTENDPQGALSSEGVEQPQPQEHETLQELATNCEETPDEDGNLELVGVGDTGFELSEFSSEKAALCEKCAAVGPAPNHLDGQFDIILTHWPQLSQTARKQILELVRLLSHR